MSISDERIPVPGSERLPVPGGEVVGPVNPGERVSITVQVRPRHSDTNLSASAANVMELGKQPLGGRHYLSRAELEAQQGADPQDLAKVESFAQKYGLTVVEANVLSRTVKLSGTVTDLSTAFGVQLQLYRSDNTVYRGRTGPVYVPRELAGIVTGVYGLDNRPVAKPHFRLREAIEQAIHAEAARPGAVFNPMNLSDGSFTTPMVAQLYDFPGGLDGTGQCIAIIELGGGYQISDLNTYFSSLGVALPPITDVSVDGATNTPTGDPNSADGEVCLDIEVAGAVAPRASLAVYLAPNTTAGFIDAVNAALFDNVNKPSVISISWGGPEDFQTVQFLNGLNQAFQNAARLGVTVCVASGDNGSSDEPAVDQNGNPRDANPHVDFPASSPFALACGGTTLSGTGTTIASEVTWNDGDSHGASGGGVSNLFPLPTYQAHANVQPSPTGNVGRGVPDVAGNADPATGYQVIVDGQPGVIGGTSAVAPLWAGLIALINQQLVNIGVQAAGFINPLIYANPSAFHDIIQGNNDITGAFGVYSAGPGWDACTGLGSPDGVVLLNVLRPTSANP